MASTFSTNEEKAIAVLTQIKDAKIFAHGYNPRAAAVCLGQYNKNT